MGGDRIFDKIDIGNTDKEKETLNPYRFLLANLTARYCYYKVTGEGKDDWRLLPGEAINKNW